MSKKLFGTFALAMLATHATAAEVDAYFDSATGKLVIPHLELNNEVYYATLSLIDGATLTFRADPSTLTNITPPSVPNTSLNTSASVIHGNWNIPGTQTTVTFNADGTYRHFEVFPANDNECTTGTETGTYVWEPSTGLMLIRTLTDSNGPCGLSNPADNVPYRFYINGNQMQILEKGDGFSPQSFALVRVTP